MQNHSSIYEIKSFRPGLARGVHNVLLSERLKLSEAEALEGRGYSRKFTTWYPCQFAHFARALRFQATTDFQDRLAMKGHLITSVRHWPSTEPVDGPDYRA